MSHVVANGVPSDYLYDAFGHRLTKSLASGATVAFQYDQSGRLLEEIDGPPPGLSGGSTIDYLYLDDGRLVGSVNTGTGQIAYVHADRLGTSEAMTDQTQSITWQASYAPYGLTTSTSGAAALNVRFPGQYFDAETGGASLHQNNQRDYSPILGRYIESDPIGLAGGINTYTYAGSNPTNYVDPKGQFIVAVLPLVPPALEALAGLGIGIGIGEAIFGHQQKKSTGQDHDQSARPCGKDAIRNRSSCKRCRLDSEGSRSAKWARCVCRSRDWEAASFNSSRRSSGCPHPCKRSRRAKGRYQWKRRPKRGT